MHAGFVDSLSTLAYYYRDNMYTLKFAHMLIKKLREKSSRGLFPFSIEKSSLELARDLQMFSDASMVIK